MDKFIELTVGDWSSDGHCETYAVVINTNLTGDELKKAYNNGAKEIGFDLSKDVSLDFQDTLLSADKLKKLIDSGYQGCDDNGSSDGWYLDLSSFIDIYLHFIKVGNPDFEFKHVPEYNDWINIGGYGLFC